MTEHLNQYVINQPYHRFVLFEKRNKSAELFLDIVNDAGWTDVIYMDYYMMIAINETSKKIIFFIISPKDESNSSFVFHNFGEKNNSDALNVASIFDCNYSEKSKNLKIPEFIHWYLSVLSICLKSVGEVKILMKKYNSGNSKNFEKDFDIIKRFLSSEFKKLELLANE